MNLQEIREAIVAVNIPKIQEFANELGVPTPMLRLRLESEKKVTKEKPYLSDWGFGEEQREEMYKERRKILDVAEARFGQKS